jgi:hypothetical protein
MDNDDMVDLTWDKQPKIVRTKWWKLKGTRQKSLKKGPSKRALGSCKEEDDKQHVGERLQPAFERYPERCVEQPKGVEAKLNVVWRACCIA